MASATKTRMRLWPLYKYRYNLQTRLNFHIFDVFWKSIGVRFTSNIGLYLYNVYARRGIKQAKRRRRKAKKGCFTITTADDTSHTHHIPIQQMKSTTAPVIENFLNVILSTGYAKENFFHPVFSRIDIRLTPSLRFLRVFDNPSICRLRFFSTFLELSFCFFSLSASSHFPRITP